MDVGYGIGEGVPVPAALKGVLTIGGIVDEATTTTWGATVRCALTSRLDS